MSIRYKTERFFDRYNHFMEFIRTMTGITVLVLQIVILKTVFVSENVKDVEDEYCKTIEFLEKEIEDDKDEIEFLDAFVDELADENKRFSSMLASIENEPGGHEILEKLWNENQTNE